MLQFYSQIIYMVIHFQLHSLFHFINSKDKDDIRKSIFAWKMSISYRLLTQIA